MAAVETELDPSPGLRGQRGHSGLGGRGRSGRWLRLGLGAGAAVAAASLPTAVQLIPSTWCVAIYRRVGEPSPLRLSERIIIEAVLPHFLFPPHHCTDKNGFSYNVLAAAHDRGLCQYDSDSV